MCLMDKPKDTSDIDMPFDLSMPAQNSSLLQFQPHQMNISPTESSAARTSSAENNNSAPDSSTIFTCPAPNMKPPAISNQGPTPQQVAAFLAQQQISLLMKNQSLLNQQNQQTSTRFPAEKTTNHQFVSHSSVEKQRRDRINSLIDELRELVPPQKETSGTSQGFSSKAEAAAADARRPKHQVLSDTISCLKALKLKTESEEKGSNWAQYQFPPQPQPQPQPRTQVQPQPQVQVQPELKVKVEGASDDEMSANLVTIPQIPVQISSFAGVSVERAAVGDGVMYVQVKCRDRRGLLSDIINALKALPLEVKTAAVVTSGEGSVRDVFEVHSYDPNLLPEMIQNVVHDALYHQRSDEGTGKRLKSRG